MEFKQLKRRIANFDDKAFTRHVYGISNEFGLVAIVYADHEQDALDAAVDNNALESELMSPEDYKEYRENGWDDSYILAGNASEPFWAENLSIRQIR